METLRALSARIAATDLPDQAARKVGAAVFT